MSENVISIYIISFSRQTSSVKILINFSFGVLTLNEIKKYLQNVTLKFVHTRTAIISRKILHLLIFLQKGSNALRVQREKNVLSF